MPAQSTLPKAEQPVGIVKLDPELEVLLDDIFDGNW